MTRTLISRKVTSASAQFLRKNRSIEKEFDASETLYTSTSLRTSEALASSSLVDILNAHAHYIHVRVRQSVSQSVSANITILIFRVGMSKFSKRGSRSLMFIRETRSKRRASDIRGA